jgi:hypothetical protein
MLVQVPEGALQLTVKLPVVLGLGLAEGVAGVPGGSVTVSVAALLGLLHPAALQDSNS